MHFFTKLAYVTCGVFTFKKKFYSVVVCCGESMAPIIHDRDIIIVSHLKQTTGNWDREHYRNKIVILKASDMPGTLLCKRVTATDEDSKHIPKGYMFVEGENQAVSRDSNVYGPVPMALIVGVVTYKIWPTFEKIK